MSRQEGMAPPPVEIARVINAVGKGVGRSSARVMRPSSAPRRGAVLAQPSVR
jgi:hypothetical protein